MISKDLTMNKKLIGFFIYLLSISILTHAIVVDDTYAQTSSSYTYINERNCQEEKDVDYPIFYSTICKGVGGYKISYSEGEDYHQFLDLISADGKDLGIDVTKISIAPSTIGQTLEWRVTKKDKNIKPYAMIFRFNVYRHGINEPDKMESLLVITKITKDSACITDTVKPSRSQNKQARKLADVSAKNPCFENDY